MLTRLLLLIIIICFSACSNSNKDSATVVPKGNEVATPEGAIIQPQTEVDTLKGSLKAHAIGKIGEANVTINYYSPATRG